MNWTFFSPVCFQLYYPKPQGVRDLLQALDTDNRLDMLPTVWKGKLQSHAHHLHQHAHGQWTCLIVHGTTGDLK